MRILVVGINYAPDLVGVAKYNTELCEALDGHGHEVRMITAPPYYPDWKVPPAYASPLYRREDRNGVRITRCPIYVPSSPSGVKRLVHHASFAVSSAGPVAWEVASWRPHLVMAVAPSLMAAPFVSFAAWAGRARSWLHVQDLEVDAAFDLGMLRGGATRTAMLAAERRILGSFDRVSTIAPQMLARIASKGVPRERLYEMRNWTDTAGIAPGDRMTSVRASLGLDGSHFIGLYAGTMSNKQGLELIVEAAARTQASHPHVRYVLCGNGPFKERLEKLAQGMDNLVFMGVQPDDRFAETLRTADFHLMPQKAEAADLVLPSKLGGIFATGRPSVVMAAPGTGLYSEVEGAGILVPPGDAGALAAAVTTLADDPGLCGGLGAAGRIKGLDRWNRASIIKSLNSELSSLCSVFESGHEPA